MYTIKNPLSEGALTPEDVRDTQRFKSYVPREPGEPDTQDTLMIGIFVSDAYENTAGDELLVDYILYGETRKRTSALSRLGITPSAISSDDKKVWGNRLTVPFE